MTGKEKCEYLKKVRADFARINGIEFTPAECTHQGDCSGHCPACEKEAEELLKHFKITNTASAPTTIRCVTHPNNDIYTIPDVEDVGLPF
jgi:hypothetical protein